LHHELCAKVPDENPVLASKPPVAIVDHLTQVNVFSPPKPIFYKQMFGRVGQFFRPFGLSNDDFAP
jgi:hypothetical protein